MTLHDQLREIGFDSQSIDRLTQIATRVNLKAGTVVFRPGDACGYYILPLSGAIDVVLLGPTGREMRLYSVTKGQLCIQTFTGLTTGETYSGEGRVMTEMEALMLTQAQFHQLMGESPSFRDFVLKTVAQRFVELSQSVLNVASTPVSQRLAKWLLEHEVAGSIKTTQSALAVDISSVREVISRTLNRWSNQAILRVERGEIKILDHERLRHLSQSECD